MLIKIGIGSHVVTFQRGAWRCPSNAEIESEVRLESEDWRRRGSYSVSPFPRYEEARRIAEVFGGTMITPQPQPKQGVPGRVY